MRLCKLIAIANPNVPLTSIPPLGLIGASPKNTFLIAFARGIASGLVSPSCCNSSSSIQWVVIDTSSSYKGTSSPLGQTTKYFNLDL